MRNINCFRGLRFTKKGAKRLTRRTKKIMKKRILLVLNGVGTAAIHRANTYRKRPVTQNWQINCFRKQRPENPWTSMVHGFIHGWNWNSILKIRALICINILGRFLYFVRLENWNWRLEIQFKILNYQTHSKEFHQESLLIDSAFLKAI